MAQGLLFHLTLTWTLTKICADFFSRLHATNHQGNCVVFVSLYSRLLKQQRVATFWLQIRVNENRAADAQLLLLLLIWAIWSINHLNQFPFDARFPIHYWPHALREWEFFFTSHRNCRLLSLAFFLLSPTFQDHVVILFVFFSFEVHGSVQVAWAATYCCSTQLDHDLVNASAVDDARMLQWAQCEFRVFDFCVDFVVVACNFFA